MKEVLFDIEVYPNWWVLVYKYNKENDYYVITSDDSNHINEIVGFKFDACLLGFYIKHYDLKILNMILKGADPKEIYQLSKALINEGQHPFNNYSYWNSFNFSDLYDDWRYGSLKEFESNIGMSIKETEVPFDKELLSDDDKKNIIKYCKHDVLATERLLEVRRKYVDAKKILADKFNLNKTQALKSTVAKLGAMLLGAVKKTYNDDPIFIIPTKVESYIKENLPESVISLFKYLDDDNKEVFLFNNEVVFGKGGIHSTISKNSFSKADDDYILVNFDATSYYPMLMIVFNYLSRNIKNKQSYISLYNMSSELKDKLEVNYNEDDANLREALKLILNASYGATKNQFNALYDPYRATSMCYLGQLLLAALSNEIHHNGGIIIQTNTDGVLAKIKRSELSKFRKIVEKWVDTVGIKMKEEQIKLFFQRDVNNYIEIKNDNSIKLKGRWTNQAEETMANLNAPITHKAILNYYVYDKPIRDTIYESNNPMDFCFTTKTGKTYDKTYYYIDGVPHLVNKVNRVVATTDTRYGTIKKYKTDEDRYDKTAEIPENSLIMNDELYIPPTLDREWYVSFVENKIKELVYV